LSPEQIDCHGQAVSTPKVEALLYAKIARRLFQEVSSVS